MRAGAQPPLGVSAVRGPGPGTRGTLRWSTETSFWRRARHACNCAGQCGAHAPRPNRGSSSFRDLSKGDVARILAWALVVLVATFLEL
jgi:hypothetical protein